MEHEIIDGIDYIAVPNPTGTSMSIIADEDRNERKAIISGKTASGKKFKVILTGQFNANIEEVK